MVSPQALKIGHRLTLYLDGLDRHPPLSLLPLDQVRSVVLADQWCGARAERVEDADGVCLGGQLANLLGSGPAEGAHLVVGGEFASGDLAVEYQGGDASAVRPADRPGRPSV